MLSIGFFSQKVSRRIKKHLLLIDSGGGLICYINPLLLKAARSLWTPDD